MGESEYPSSDWPEEVRKAYDNLKIPSIYDCVVANEKLSLELHKQNRDIKDVLEGVQTLSSRIDSVLHAIVEEMEIEDEERPHQEFEGEGTFEEAYGGLSSLEVQLLNEKTEDLLKQTKEVIIHTTDHLIDVSETVKLLMKYLIECIPKGGLFSREQDWQKMVKDIATKIVMKVDEARYHHIAKLDDLNIQLINPKPGDPLDLSKHFVLESIEGGQSGTIAKLVKVGYQEEHKILRHAEVISY